MEGYVFINTEPGTAWNIAKAAQKIEGVKMAHAVTGQFDVVLYVEFTNMDALSEIIGGLQALKGIQRTRTAVAIPERLE